MNAEQRYCFYCDSYRERFRCEACGNDTRGMKPAAQSDLPPSWRAALSSEAQPSIPNEVSTGNSGLNEHFQSPLSDGGEGHE